MSRRVGWFSCGAASLAAVVLARPECDVIAYCETGSEHPDNERFLGDCERRFGFEVVRLRSEIFKDTWDVWTRRRYMGGIAGAPCTRALKVLPRLRWQRPDDIHVFGYTSEERDRAHRLRTAWKGAVVECPLIDLGLSKAATLALAAKWGLKPPLTYELGFHNANCLPCPKATAPGYWAAMRMHFPDQFNRAAELSRELGVKLVRVAGERRHLDDLPSDVEPTPAIVPACDLLCDLVDDQ